MADISLIKELREETGLSFGQINKAVTEAGGDRAKALELLKAWGATVASKKSGRTLGSGIVEAYVHSNRRVGSILSLLCETDFVARNEEFHSLAKDIAMHIAAMRPADEAELLAQEFVKDASMTVQDRITAAIAKLGENIRIGTFSVISLS